VTFARFKFPLTLPEHLILSPDQVAMLNSGQREDRVVELTALADYLFTHAKVIAETHMSGRWNRKIVAAAGMFSGGNDSTVMAYVMRKHLTHLIHADTGVGLQATRQFVEETAAALGLPLLTPTAPRPEDRYSALVRQYGFPGPGMHTKMYNRLKERAWREARRHLVTDGHHQRMIFVAGRRRNESTRRAKVPELEREDSVVWVSPMVLWTKLDLNTYRRMHDIPVNPVYEVLHMSGECLCGCYAQEGEREWLFRWFPEDGSIRQIQQLERMLGGRENIPAECRIWGRDGQARKCMTGVCNT
jgi:3'-phosphoadenosine 5'-phosphosulfate sulfotransferase (PAPS reductase)/FAD synthetase